jgi:hypothetical protein
VGAINHLPLDGLSLDGTGKSIVFADDYAMKKV